MAAGLEVWNSSGVLVFSRTDRIGKALGIHLIPAGVNGSISNSNLSRGTPFWTLSPTGIYFFKGPTITVSGNTLSWDWEGIAGIDMILVYGVL